MHRLPLIVLKFGSSVLSHDRRLVVAVHEIYRWVREGWRVLAVVSAIGDETDHLFDRARQYGDSLNDSVVASLVATGETTSAALLALALERAGLPAILLDAARLGLRARGPVLMSDPYEVDCDVIARTFEEYPVAIVPGYVGVGEDRGVALFGRGGSDLTAIFLATQLGADACRLLKDVNGLYERDPALVSALPPRRYKTLTFDAALALGGGVVQPKAVHFAKTNGLEFEVAGLGTGDPTYVGARTVGFYQNDFAPARLTVGVLGLGFVGLGVYRALMQATDTFELVGVAVRSVGAREEIDPPILSGDPWEVLNREPDVVVELMGGTVPAREIIAAALERGIHVVTANKAVMARDGEQLHRIAKLSGARLLYSAAVGGAVPMLEAVARVASQGPIREIEGVLNGTTSFVLDKLAGGTSFDEAVELARAKGFAEADPTYDLDGTDAANKLALLARAGFEVSLPLSAIRRTGIHTCDPDWVRVSSEAGFTVRLVARVKRKDEEIRACVAPEALPPGHLLARSAGEGNSLLVHPISGDPVYLYGKGAGRWPTTEAVLADLFEIARDAKRAELRPALQPLRGRS
jgi:homoserine dehydrogenase